MSEEFEEYWESALIPNKLAISKIHAEHFWQAATLAMQAKMDRLEAIESAATALVKCKGRYHAELNMKALIKAVEQKL